MTEAQYLLNAIASNMLTEAEALHRSIGDITNETGTIFIFEDGSAIHCKTDGSMEEANDD